MHTYQCVNSDVVMYNYNGHNVGRILTGWQDSKTKLKTACITPTECAALRLSAVVFDKTDISYL